MNTTKATLFTMYTVTQTSASSQKHSA